MNRTVFYKILLGLVLLPLIHPVCAKEPEYFRMDVRGLDLAVRILKLGQSGDLAAASKIVGRAPAFDTRKGNDFVLRGFKPIYLYDRTGKTLKNKTVEWVVLWELPTPEKHLGWTFMGVTSGGRGKLRVIFAELFPP